MFANVPSGIDEVIAAVTYTLSTQTLSWDDAQSDCESRGQRLAVLDTLKKGEDMIAQIGLVIKLFFNNKGQKLFSTQES